MSPAEAGFGAAGEDAASALAACRLDAGARTGAAEVERGSEVGLCTVGATKNGGAIAPPFRGTQGPSETVDNSPSCGLARKAACVPSVVWARCRPAMGAEANETGGAWTGEAPTLEATGTADCSKATRPAEGTPTG